MFNILSKILRPARATVGNGTFVSSKAELRGGNIRLGDRCRILKYSKLDTSCNPSRPDKVKFTQKGFINIGIGSTVKEYALLYSYDGFIEIGSGCSINPFTIVYGHGGVQIGNNVMIASHCTLVSASHVIDSTMIPISKQGMTARGIRIEDDVWVGSGVRILDGASIAKGCVIGAGSVILGNTEPYGVYAGAPARLLRTRR
jgi:acetyltransferase-like isoleucine patch superfamily enzyme